MMGSTDDQIDHIANDLGVQRSRMNAEKPAGKQCFDKPFWIDRTEVTNKQYGSEGSFKGDNRPRDSVSWFSARALCEKRGVRLPTEAEWEYAARGPDSLIYPWGNSFVGDNVIYQGDSGGQTAEVGGKLRGVSWVRAFDMSGNLWEWVSSIYKPYPYDARDGRENDNDGSSPRILRGGSYGDYSYGVRAANRASDNPYNWSKLTGFRCARDYEQP